MRSEPRSANGQASAYIIAKSAFDAAQEGRLSEFDLNTVMCECARVYFDGSMAKMLDSELGKIFLAPRTMRKSLAEETAAQANASNAPVDQPEHNSGRITERERAEKTARAIKHHMANGDSYDVAATKAYRAEKKESDQGSHQNENNRPWRRISGATVNDNGGEEDAR
jgi:hypothetical protein